METLIVLLQGIGLLLLVLVLRRLRNRGQEKGFDRAAVSRPPEYYDTAGRARRYEGAGSRGFESARNTARDGAQSIDQPSPLPIPLSLSGFNFSQDDDTRRGGGSSSAAAYASGGGYGGDGGSSDGGGDGGGGGG